MAVIVADSGGEHYASLSLTAAVTAGWWASHSGGSVSNAAPSGRQAASDGKFYAINLPNTGDNVVWQFANRSHPIEGVALYFTNPPVNATLLQFLDAGSVQTDVRTNALGQIIITRNGTTIGGPSTQVVPAGWNYIELDVTFATGATGAAQCWLNSVSVVNVSSVQTAATANAFANQLKFVQSGSSTFLKDIWLLDATTGANTTHLGDVSVGVKYPNAAGVNQQWTPLSGTQVSNVQDGITHTGTWPDGDSTYISDGTTGHISDFGHETLSLTGTLLAVVHVTYARKDDAGSRAFRQVCLSGGTTETNGADLSATNTYLYYIDVLDQDPNTSAAWTVANYNAATFGVKEIT
jgi:hypothetical protein